MDQSAKPSWAPEKPQGQPEDLEPPIKDGYRYPHNRHQNATPHLKKPGESLGAGLGGQGAGSNG